MRQVVDASAILAYLLDEPGGDIPEQDEGPFCLSSVNLAEVLSKVADRGLSPDDVRRVLKRLPVEQFDHDRHDARHGAELRDSTRALGLSLGDCAGLTLAARLGLPAATADAAWAKLDIGIDIRLIR